MANNQSYVNPIILFDFLHHVTQGGMVLEQSNHLLTSHGLHTHCTCANGLWVYWDPVTAKQLHELPFTNNM